MYLSISIVQQQKRKGKRKRLGRRLKYEVCSLNNFSLIYLLFVNLICHLFSYQLILSFIYKPVCNSFLTIITKDKNCFYCNLTTYKFATPVLFDSQLHHLILCGFLSILTESVKNLASEFWFSALSFTRKVKQGKTRQTNSSTLASTLLNNLTICILKYLIH